MYTLSRKNESDDVKSLEAKLDNTNNGEPAIIVLHVSSG